ncbi:MAG: lysophospholipid acyltransferase family protein [Aestuariibacter sp.]
MAISFLDRLLGLSRMQRIYASHKMQGLSKEAFSDRLLEALNVRIKNQQGIISAVPQEGAVVIASNHPFGGLEGVILARVLGQARPDLKVLANFALEMFAELKDYFIFTNPLSERDPRNGPSLRACMGHVKKGGALMLFPAGRVSYFRKDLNRISEHQWNRIVAKLICAGDAHYVPVFVEGVNSKKFYRAGRIHDSLRMFFLGHELLNKRGQEISIQVGNPVSRKLVDSGNLSETAALCRALSYAISNQWCSPWTEQQSRHFTPLADKVDRQLIKAELAALPDDQQLLSYKGFDVYYGQQAQFPNVVQEIARQRERVFREHDEGSGAAIDSDHFDATYTHLLVVERDSGDIIGAYRMGRTDKLLQHGGIEHLYLSQMFDFKPAFYNQQEPCLELGRSFVVPEQQKSFHGLYLLWRGIAAFVCKYPQYRRLYGTVSLSKLYDKRSLAIIREALISPHNSVAAKVPFDHALHPELVDFHTEYGLRPYVSTFLKTIEADGKDIPILLKHYMKLGAEFYALGLDGNFADTPGLLLSVDLKSIPEKSARQFFGKQYDTYYTE